MPGFAWAVPGRPGSDLPYYGRRMIEWEPDPERPLWQQMMEVLRQRILDGAYQPRTKIPSLKQLTQEFQVGLNTARHAVADLEDQGFLRSIKSLGTFVSPADEWPEES